MKVLPSLLITLKFDGNSVAIEYNNKGNVYSLTRHLCMCIYVLYIYMYKTVV